MAFSPETYAIIKGQGGKTGGFATINSNGKIPAEQIPGFIEIPSDVIAPDYSSESTYAVGSFVLYESALYRCTTEIETPEEWTAAHWTLTNACENITLVTGDDEGNITFYGG